MRGMVYFRCAVLGLALSGLTAFAQTPQSTPPTSGPTTAQPSAPAATTTPAVAAMVNGEPIYEEPIQRTLSNYPVGARAEGANESNR